MGSRRLVIVDADILAGWRRASPSLAQLHDAVGDLERQEPDAVIAVVADPSLKWALDESEREGIEDDIREGRLLFAPAGCRDGHVGFIARVVEVARERGFAPVVVTDRAVVGADLGRPSREGDRWVFQLSGVEASLVAPSRPSGRRRRSSSAA